ncbi:MAG TPA: ABC transporter permease [Candidatus Caenarcaniphilales bacterium]|nr:ABC transporter permease [Candidatus Caenarcaniphilales bacterium]
MTADATSTRRSFLRLVGLVARRDYVRTVRRRGFVFGTVLLPLAIAGFTVLATLFAPRLQPSSGSVPVAVVNDSDLELSVRPGARLSLMSREEARQALAGGDIGEYYLIPAQYPEEATILRVVGPPRGPGIEDLQRRAQQEQVLTTVLVSTLVTADDVPPATMERLLEPYRLEDRSADGSGAAPPFEAAFVVPYAFTFLFVMSIFITSGYLLQSVTEEKENRVVEILLSSVPSLPLMTGKILGLGAAGLTQVAIWVATALAALPFLATTMPGLERVSISPVTLALALCFFVVGYLSYGAIFAAIGALAPGTREAQQYSGFFGFFAVIPLVFAGAFIADPNSPVVVVLSLLPLTAPAAMLQVLALVGEPPWPLVATSLGLLAIFAALAAVAAARVFRATLLLYGTRPSLRRIVEAIAARG